MIPPASFKDLGFARSLSLSLSYSCVKIHPFLNKLWAVGKACQVLLAKVFSFLHYLGIGDNTETEHSHSAFSNYVQSTCFRMCRPRFT